MISLKRVLVVALIATGFIIPVTSSARAIAGSQHRACAKLFTPRMGKRAARAIYSGTHRVTLKQLRLLGYIERCQRSPTMQKVVRNYDHRLDRAHKERRRAALHPLSYSTVSWYNDAGTHCCGVYAYYGVADCANYTINCYPMGTKVEFYYGGRYIIATVDDHGPYVGGRGWDLNQNTAGAIGFSGVGQVGWRVIS